MVGVRNDKTLEKKKEKIQTRIEGLEVGPSL
jgi:hypothetical protein